MQTSTMSRGAGSLLSKVGIVKWTLSLGLREPSWEDRHPGIKPVSGRKAHLETEFKNLRIAWNGDIESPGGRVCRRSTKSGPRRRG